MISTRSIFNESTYPGDYVPKHQILRALSEGDIEKRPAEFKPKVSITDSDSSYKIEFTEPGIKREDLLVTINEHGNLCVLSMKSGAQGKHTIPINDSRKEFEVFMKEIPLPDNVDSAFTSAACHGGTLTIFFKKADYPVSKRPSTIVVY